MENGTSSGRRSAVTHSARQGCLELFVLRASAGFSAGVLRHLVSCRCDSQALVLGVRVGRRSMSRAELLLLLEDGLHLGVVAGDTAAQQERVGGSAPGPTKVVELQPLARI